MRILLSVLLFSAVLSAQTITGGGVKVWNLTNRAAQFYFTFTGTITTGVLHYGTTASYGRTENLVWNTTADVMTAWAELGTGTGGELLPNTLYHYKIVLNGANATADLTFTTLNQTLQDPIAPTPVTWFSGRNADPVGTYNAPVTYTTCAQWATFLTHAGALTGANHQRYYFTGEWNSPGCGEEQYVFPARPVGHTGWAVAHFVSAANYAMFAPEGTRVRPEYSHMMGKIFQNMPHMTSAGSNNYNITTVGCTTSISGDDGMLQITSAPQGSIPIIQCRIDWPQHFGTVNVAAQPCTVNANLDVSFTVPAGHAVTPGMLLVVNPNECSNASSNLGGATPPSRPYLVESVTATSIQMWNLKRKTGFAAITTPFTLGVNNQWRQPSAVDNEVETGTGPPVGTCDENAGHKWYVDTAKTTTLDRSWWCVDATGNDAASSVGKWRRIIPNAGGALLPGAAVMVADGAARWRIVGLEIVASAVPNPPPAGWFTGNANQNRIGSVAMIGVSEAQQIVFDRLYIHAEGGADPPIRIRSVLNFETCTDCGFINTYSDDVSQWSSTQVDYTQAESTSWVNYHSGGPGLIRNNHVKGAFTIIVYSEDRTNAPPAHDWTLFRNNIVQDFRFQGYASPENALYNGTPYEGMRSSTRNGPELKQGKRHQWIANRMQGMWRTVTDAAIFIVSNNPRTISGWTAMSITGIVNGVVTLSARTGAYIGDGVVISGTGSAYDGLHQIAAVANCRYLTDDCTQLTLAGSLTGTAGAGTMRYVNAGGHNSGDIDIRWNLATDTTEALRVLGSSDSATSTNAMCGPALRIRLSDNLFVNADSTTNGVPVTTNTRVDGGYRTFYIQVGTEHAQFKRNTFYNLRGYNPRVVLTEPDPGAYLMDVKDNLVKLGTSTLLSNIIEGDGLKAAGLDAAWTPGGWSWDKVVICCGISAAIIADQPDGTYWPAAENDLRMRRPSTALRQYVRPADYGLKYTAGSTYTSGGGVPSTQGKDIGVDVDELSVQLGEVLNVGSSVTGTTTATVRYSAPNADVCSVDYLPVATDPEDDTWGLGTRVSDGGGARRRNVNLTGLTTKTAYRYRISCEAEQPSGTFITQ